MVHATVYRNIDIWCDVKHFVEIQGRPGCRQDGHLYTGRHVTAEMFGFFFFCFVPVHLSSIFTLEHFIVTAMNKTIRNSFKNSVELIQFVFVFYPIQI